MSLISTLTHYVDGPWRCCGYSVTWRCRLFSVCVQRFEHVAEVWDQARAEVLSERHSQLQEKLLLQQQLVRAQDRRAEQLRQQQEQQLLQVSFLSIYLWRRFSVCPCDTSVSLPYVLLQQG